MGQSYAIPISFYELRVSRGEERSVCVVRRKDYVRRFDDPRAFALAKELLRCSENRKAMMLLMTDDLADRIHGDLVDPLLCTFDAEGTFACVVDGVVISPDVMGSVLAPEDLPVVLAMIAA
jgi:hypothetical protein